MRLHHRLGHIGMQRLKKAINNGAYEDIDSSTIQVKDLELSYTGCLMGKSTRKHFNREQRLRRAKEVNERIHVDLGGPHDSAKDDSRYFLAIVDDFTGYATYFPLHSKADAASALKSYITMAERQQDKLIKVIRSDNGGEFLSVEL